MAVMTVDVTEMATTVHAHAAAATMDAMATATATVPAATMAAGKRVGGPEHSKAERSVRGDGQQYRLPKHSVLLCDPWGIPLGIAMNRLSGPLVGRLFQKVQDPAKGHV
jgi:hypothetical protein